MLHMRLTLQNHAGLTDRAQLFSWLLDVGDIANASVSIDDSQPASAWLSAKHAQVGTVSPSAIRSKGSWSKYFDVHANNGEPFAPRISNGKSDTPPIWSSCLQVTSCAMLQAMLHHGVPSGQLHAARNSTSANSSSTRCLELRFSPYTCEDSLAVSGGRSCGIRRLLAKRRVTPRCLRLAPAIVRAYGWLRRRLAQSQKQSSLQEATSLGFVRVRRHDKGQSWCTEVGSIVRRMERCKAGRWMLVVYDYPGVNRKDRYAARLRQQAAERNMSSMIGIEDVLEAAVMRARHASALDDEAALRAVELEDNYVRFALEQLLSLDASSRVDTHRCDAAEVESCFAPAQLLAAMWSDQEGRCLPWSGSPTEAPYPMSLAECCEDDNCMPLERKMRLGTADARRQAALAARHRRCVQECAANANRSTHVG